MKLSGFAIILVLFIAVLLPIPFVAGILTFVYLFSAVTLALSYHNGIKEVDWKQVRIGVDVIGLIISYSCGEMVLFLTICIVLGLRIALYARS